MSLLLFLALSPYESLFSFRCRCCRCHRHCYSVVCFVFVIVVFVVVKVVYCSPFHRCCRFYRCFCSCHCSWFCFGYFRCCCCCCHRCHCADMSIVFRRQGQNRRSLDKYNRPFSKLHPAFHALKWSLAGVSAHVCRHGRGLGEISATQRARVWLLACVRADMSHEVR